MIVSVREERRGAGRLGRHVEHDPRSRAFAVRAAPVAPLRTVVHRRHVPIYDQGALGSCTGNAMAGALSTGPWPHRFGEPTAVRLYKRATTLDSIPGAYPPNDTGSSGLGVAKAAVAYGWIGAYGHAFDLTSTLVALQSTPVIIGIDWLEGYDTPGPRGLLTAAGSVRGGHEIVVDLINVERREVGGANSWGTGWGDAGRWRMSWDTLAAALAADGDVTVPRLA